LKKIIIMCLLILFSLNLFSADLQLKEPAVAGVLSFAMTGVGQFYAKAYTKGSIMLGGDFIDKIILSSFFVYFSYTYDEFSWLGFSGAERGMLIGYLVLSFSLKLYSIIDAVISADMYNKKLIKGSGKLLSRVGLDCSRSAVISGVTYRF